MTSQVLYGLHRLETGKTYIAFDPSDNSKVRWSGRVLGSAGNGELVVIEQQDPGQTLAVVWNWNFSERGGVRANFHELGSSEVFDGLQPLITTDDSMAIAFELLVEQRRRPADCHEDIATFLRRCEHGWWYGERGNNGSPSVSSAADLHAFGKDEGELAQTACRLLQVQGLLCEQSTCRS